MSTKNTTESTTAPPLGAATREDLLDTAFGRVLSELMESRGIPPTEGEAFILAAKAGVNAWMVLDRMASAENRWAGNRKRLADALDLDPKERRRLYRALDHEAA